MYATMTCSLTTNSLFVNISVHKTRLLTAAQGVTDILLQLLRSDLLQYLPISMYVLELFRTSDADETTALHTPHFLTSYMC